MMCIGKKYSKDTYMVGSKPSPKYQLRLVAEGNWGSKRLSSCLTVCWQDNFRTRGPNRLQHMDSVGRGRERDQRVRVVQKQNL